MINVFIVVSIAGVFLLWNGKVTFPSKLTVRLKHTGLAIGDDWIAESRQIDSVPGPTKDDITSENLVFKRGSKCAIVLWIFNHSFDATSDTRDCLERGTSEFGNFKTTREHTLDESRVFHDFVWLADQFKLLHHFEC